MKTHIEIELTDNPTVGLITSLFHPKEMNIQRTIKVGNNICKAERIGVIQRGILKSNLLHIYTWSQRQSAYSHYVETKDGSIVFKDYKAPNF